MEVMSVREFIVGFKNDEYRMDQLLFDGLKFRFEYYDTSSTIPDTLFIYFIIDNKNTILSFALVNRSKYDESILLDYAKTTETEQRKGYGFDLNARAINDAINDYGCSVIKCKYSKAASRLIQKLKDTFPSLDFSKILLRQLN